MLKLWKFGASVGILTVIVAALAKSELLHGFNDEAVSASEHLSTMLGRATYKTNFPVVGMGVGNLAYDRIEPIITKGVYELGYRMIDTAHASQNEEMIRDAIMKLNGGKGEIHVVTKVWYTHLGYNRTRLSVKESAKALKSTNPDVEIKMHVLLHWPRCRDDIEWMDCEGEEERLPQYVKDAGPPPHLNPNMAWKHSWRALEEMMVYPSDEFPVASIGVSNFEIKDAKSLLDSATFPPEIVQINLWTLVFDPHLIKLFYQAGVHFQVYNVMNGVFSNTDGAPNAYDALVVLANTMGSIIEEKVTPQQLVLTWLVQAGISVIPRTSSEEHLAENSAMMIGRIPHLQQPEIELIKSAVGALLRGIDLELPRASFHAPSASSVHLFWSDPTSGEEVAIKSPMEPGETFHTTSRSGQQVFVAYDESMSRRKEYTTKAKYGEQEDFHIEL
jgi:diketogulonate reductase-like aldo/keto reductase